MILLRFIRQDMKKKSARLPERLKKTREECFAIVLQYTTPGFDTVQKTPVGEIHSGTAAAGDIVKRAKDEPAKLCVHARARAHRTGFQRDIQRTIGQSIATQSHRFPQAYQLRVLGCVVIPLDAIVCARDNFASTN
jgi:hypothetical protein